MRTEFTLLCFVVVGNNNLTNISQEKLHRGSAYETDMKDTSNWVRRINWYET